MNTERWQQVEELFFEACRYEKNEQQIFLEQACGQDQELRREVESLIRHDESSGDLIESRPLRVASRLLEEWEDGLNSTKELDLDYLARQIGPRYRIVEKLGSGGMGVVYKAEDTKLGRFVALKFLLGPLHENGDRSDLHAFEHFRQEARACSALDHPGICTVYEVEQREGLSFIVMQFLTGQTLKDTIGDKPLATDQILDLSIQIADALYAAHSAGVIHGDIKPANIFVTQRGETKILDFGLAKLSAELSETDAASESSSSKSKAGSDPHSLIGSAIWGTAAYVSPEQVRWEKLNFRSDIFSLGTVLYEMAAGRKAFNAQGSAQIFSAILYDEPRELAQINPGLPAELERIITKCLRKRSEDRYSSTADLRDDLIRLKQQLSPTRETRTVGIFTKRRTLAGLAACVILLAGAVLWNLRPSTHTSHENGRVVVADFSNSTGDSVFDETLKQALRVELEQSPFLNIVSDEKALQQLKFMGRPRDTKIVGDVGKEVCLRTGSDVLLSGSIAHLGQHFVIGLSALNCQTGETLVSEQAEVENRESVLRGLDKTVTELRAKLGESLASIKKYDAPVAQATTASLEALRAYSLGLKARATDGQAATIPFFQRAIELDPDFAMAYAHLATAYFDLVQTTNAKTAIEKAFELRGRVSERERLYIESAYYLTGTGQDEKAIQVYQQWRTLYPRDVTPYMDLGATYSMLGQQEKALVELSSALALEPANGLVYLDLAAVYTNLNQFDKAQEVVQQAQKHKVGNAAFIIPFYQFAFHRNDKAEMLRLAESTIGQSGIESVLLAMQADTEAYYGHLKKAREFTQRAIAAALRDGDMETANSYKVAGVLHETEFGNSLQARRQIKSLRLPNSGQAVQTLSALGAARSGAPAVAQRLADELRRQSPLDTLLTEYWLPTIQAAAELDTNPDKAIEDLKGTMPYELATPQSLTSVVAYPVYIRGMADLVAGQGTAAVAEFQKILDHAGLLGNSPLMALARLGLARAYAEEAGFYMAPSRQYRKINSSEPSALANARRTYQEFFTLWKDADSDIPILRQAHMEYMRITQ